MRRSRGLPLHHRAWHEPETGLDQPVPNRNSQRRTSIAHTLPTYVAPRTEPAQVTFHIGRIGSGTTASHQDKLYPGAIPITHKASPPWSAWILIRKAIRHPFANSQKLYWILLLMLAGGISSGIVVSHLFVLAASPAATSGSFAKRTMDKAASAGTSRMPMSVEELRKSMLDSEPDATGSRIAVPLAAPAASAPLRTSGHLTVPRKAEAASAAACSEPLQALGLCGVQPDQPSNTQ